MGIGLRLYKIYTPVKKIWFSPKILTFDVSNVTRQYDHIFWQLRNRKYLEW